MIPGPAWGEPVTLALPIRGRPVLGRISALDAAAFVIPAMSFLEVTIVGRLIVTEILLLVALPWLWRFSRPRIPSWFLLLWAVWLISQIVTDIVVGSRFSDWARGWAGIVFTLTNFVAILALVSTPQRARLFGAGLAVGGMLGLLFVPHPAAASDPWKWGVALPAGFLLAAAVSGRAGDRWRWLTVSAFAALGVLNVVLGYRSLAGIAVLVAGYLALAALFRPRKVGHEHSPRRAGAALILLALTGIVVLAVYSWTASQGLLGPEQQRRYSGQGGAFGVVLGGRPEALVSTEAILDSPLLGHGSWARDPAYAKLLAERQEEFGYEVNPIYVGTDLIPTHSFLLGAWVWAGVLGALFWIAVAVPVVWLLGNLYSARLELAPLLVFAALLLLWDIAFSPYGFGTRITAPYELALSLLGLRLLRETQARPWSSGPGGEPHHAQVPQPVDGHRPPAVAQGIESS